jgi:deoxyribose-phosphate aldolase
MKVIGTEKMLEIGADEIDMVGNTGYLKDGNTDAYIADIEAVANALAEFNHQNDAIRGLKVIIETCYLTDCEKEFAAACVADTGLKYGIPIFVKTSSGFGQPPTGVPTGATIDDVLLIRKTVGEYDPETNPIGVKASGGIRDAVTAVKMVIAGGGFDDNLNTVSCLPCAMRIGTSSSRQIIGDFEEVYGGKISFRNI